MSDTSQAQTVPWYTDASLVGPGRVYCTGSLAQCVRKWTRLPEMSRDAAHIQLGSSTLTRVRVDVDEIAALAANPELRRV
jgi:hypothetical protein